ncbi:MAG: hypothetical protein HY518_02970 [Candidatus Aenigmarchaeota archaeon]|nr:hypothetical protein [Candidatus Aenigmarchaeota archaeon]
MDLSKIQKMKSEFDRERGWDKSRASNVLVHLLEELGEVGRFVNFEEKYKTREIGHEHGISREELGREFAQSFMLFLQLANHYGIDLERAFADEIKIMEKRFRK